MQTAFAICDHLVFDGQVVFEVTPIGKECHNSGCAIKKATADCIMPKDGIFTKVILGRVVKTSIAIARERIAVTP